MLANKLSDRQMDVCRAFIKSKGIDVIQFICGELNIAPSTVKTHIADIYHILLINSHAQLMFYLMNEILKRKPTD